MKARTRALLLLLGTLVCLVTSPAHPQAAPEHEVIIVDAKGPSRPFPHFWEKMFGSGRAILSLRENYRQDLRRTPCLLARGHLLSVMARMELVEAH